MQSESTNLQACSALLCVIMHQPMRNHHRLGLFTCRRERKFVEKPRAFVRPRAVYESLPVAGYACCALALARAEYNEVQLLAESTVT